MRPSRRAPAASILCVLFSALGLLAAPGDAVASTRQLALLQPGPVILSMPSQTLGQLRSLGVGVVRVIINWSLVAPNPNSTTRPHFNGADPRAYPAAKWAPYDAIVNDARADGIAVDFTIGSGAPRWADGPGVPPFGRTPMYAWEPSPSLYGAFVQAVGTRYSGHFVPPGQSTALPRVSFWQIWNEPNFGENLAPQATDGSRVPASAGMYRSLLDAGWHSLLLTGHGHDTILIGTLAARGAQVINRHGTTGGQPGQYGTTKPLIFTRALYCLDSSYQPLTGSAARSIGCPTTAAGSRGFRRAHPALFGATGFADHPYPLNLPPTKATANDPDYTEFSQLPNLATTLDDVQKAYGSPTRFPIYITEYGYITNPPNRGNYVSPATAAEYINWAEYLEWRNPRIASTMQYPLSDPNPNDAPEFGGFASGLLFYSGRPKPAYDAYRLPLFLPVTSAHPGHSLEVWGCVRPAHLAPGRQTASFQFQPGPSGAFTTVRTVTITSPMGYFDVRIAFRSSGSVRLQWTYPDGTVADSRIVKISVS